METTSEGMRKYFEQFGEVIDSVVMKKWATGISRRFGFITMRQEEAMDAILDSNHVLDGKNIEVKRALVKGLVHIPSKKLYVATLPLDVTDGELKDYFSQFGGVEEAEVMIIKETGESRGFGFVTFQEIESVRKALAQSHSIHDKSIVVKIAQPKGFEPGVAPPPVIGRGFTGNKFGHPMPPQHLGTQFGMAGRGMHPMARPFEPPKAIPPMGFMGNRPPFAPPYFNPRMEHQFPVPIRRQHFQGNFRRHERNQEFGGLRHEMGRVEMGRRDAGRHEMGRHEMNRSDVVRSSGVGSGRFEGRHEGRYEGRHEGRHEGRYDGGRFEDRFESRDEGRDSNRFERESRYEGRESRNDSRLDDKFEGREGRHESGRHESSRHDSSARHESGRHERSRHEKSRHESSRHERSRPESSRYEGKESRSNRDSRFEDTRERESSRYEGRESRERESKYESRGEDESSRYDGRESRERESSRYDGRESRESRDSSTRYESRERESKYEREGKGRGSHERESRFEGRDQFDEDKNFRVVDHSDRFDDLGRFGERERESFDRFETGGRDNSVERGRFDRFESGSSKSSSNYSTTKAGTRITYHPYARS
mmetsp:Transcript_39067/g.54483  ORF Transcript_39067/g.54483 Transcript_39067/m.54483 type:complete len:597 (+) Transcript_39067:100-1890(+)